MCWRLLLIPVLAASVCTGFDKVGETTFDQPAPKVGALGSKFDVYEAVFRHEMKRFAEAKPKRMPIFFLSIDGEDPPPQFLERFDKAAAVRPVSKVKAKTPEEFGVLLECGQIEMKETDKARVLGNAYELIEKLKCGTPYPTVLSRQDGKWVVVVK